MPSFSFLEQLYNERYNPPVKDLCDLQTSPKKGILKGILGGGLENGNC